MVSSQSGGQYDISKKTVVHLFKVRDRMNKRMVDLFAGCGGLGLGMEKAGFKVILASDIDPNCMKTYSINRNFDEKRMFIGDIAELNKSLCDYDELNKEIDLVCGGPPCQGFSTANRQRIIDDPRNILYREYLLFLKNVRPKFFIMENVRGMMNKMSEITEDVAAYLGDEYNASYTVFNANDFGVPQHRDRLIIIGNRVGIESKEIIDSITEKNRHTRKFILKDAIAGLPELKPNRMKNSNKIENDDVGYFVRDYEYDVNDYYRFINGNRVITKIYNHKNRYNNDRDIEIYTRLPQGANSLHSSIADIMPYKSRNHLFKDKYYKLKEDEVCKTITSHMKFDCNMYIHPTQPRGLSPREAARIQTFPDDFVFYGPQNDWYKQIGNAVPVKMAEAIGREVIGYL